MFNGYIKLFIKNHKDVEDPSVKEAHGKLASITGIILNLLMCSFKIIVGLLTGAISVLSDGINNLSDAGSSVITFFGFKLSSKKADKKHPYGHGRVEYFSGLIVSVVIIIVALQLLKDSVLKIINGEVLSYSLNTFFIVTIIVLSVSIVIKFIMALFFRFVGKKIGSLSLVATSKDCISDCISTTVVLICAIISLYFKDVPLDAIGGIIVSLFIAYTGIRSVLEVVSPLLGEAPDGKEVKRISEFVCAYDENVVGIHDLMMHDYGLGRRFLVLHVEVPAEGDIMDLHDMVDNIEKDLADKFNLTVTVHMDPVYTQNQRVDELRELIKTKVKEIDKEFDIHDFRMNEGATHTNAIFDLVMTHETNLTEGEIEKALTEKLKDQENLKLVITFEYSMV